MSKFRAKQINVIEAEQFLPPLKIPEGVINVYSLGGMNTGAPTEFTGEVWTIQGEKVRVKSGEWIIQEPDNSERFYPISDEVFTRKYEPVPN